MGGQQLAGAITGAATGAGAAGGGTTLRVQDELTMVPLVVVDTAAVAAMVGEFVGEVVAATGMTEGATVAEGNRLSGGVAVAGTLPTLLTEHQADGSEGSEAQPQAAR
mmetsp:Transcript_9120/g.20201  ORF Transcript_9120/g.20201 Transcript_9120/m.20201 type:complete len:108 (+) Transcript_9120:283-606(+)